MFKMKSAVLAAFVTCLLASSPLPARASDHQFDEPLRIVAPASPGGIFDHASCPITKSLSDTITQTAIFESAPGVGGTLGIQAILRAKLDGKTVVGGSLGPNAANYKPYQKLPYKAQDMEQVLHVLSTTNVLVARHQLREKSIAVSTTDASSHLTSELFKSSAGVSAVNFVYRADVLALADLTTGRVDLTAVGQSTPRQLAFEKS